jgi:GNAT superfamily N-acetyltransferase
MYIEKVSAITPEIFDSVRRLVPLLGIHKPKPSYNDLVALIESGPSSLLIARFPDRDSQIVGMLTISIYRVPTGARSIVEDLVVDENVRGKGIAKALMMEALEIARGAGANGIALTSNPLRVDANQFYLRMGFRKRETNSYFFDLK